MLYDVQKRRSLSSVLKENCMKAVRSEHFPLIAILIVLIAGFATMTDGKSLHTDNLLNILLQSSMVGVVSVGQALVLITAGIDLSVGGTAVLVACIGASLLSTEPSFLGSIPLAAGLVLMLLAGAGFGAINGVLVSRLRLAPLIVTLATWQIANGTAFVVSHGGDTIRAPGAVAFIAHQSIGGVPIPAFIFIAFIVLGYSILRHTTFGHSIYAVGGNEATAWLSGIRVSTVRFWVYVISGLCAAVAAMVQMSRVMAASPNVITGLELDSIAAVVIGGVSLFGGKGSIIGVLVGVLILGVINNGMNMARLNIFMQYMVKGGIILVAVAIDAWRRRRLS